MSQPDAHVLSRFLAKQIVKSAKKGAPAEEDLAKAISEVELETQIAGASFIKVTVIDPEWAIITSGWIDVVEGLVDQIEVEFPEKSGWFWRLCAIDGSTDRTQANLTLTFEDRIVAYMREYWGPKTAPPGTSTRAQFIRDLVREVGHKGEPPIDFRCKAINKVQPVEPSSEEKTEALQTAAAKDSSEAKANKAAGLNAGSPATVKGQKLSSQQVVEANTLLSTADGLDAPLVAKEALVFAAVAESSLGDEAGAFTPNSAGYYGVLQGSASIWPDPHDTKGMATSFLLGGKGFQAGGAIALAKTVSDPIEIAVRVEAPSVWPANAYASESGYSNFLPEAKQIVSAGGGAADSAAGETVSDVGQLARGTTDNPDEDNWECGTRLAAQVTWFLFSSGNSMFYMDGPELIRQRPALHINAPANKVTKANGKIEEGVIQTPLTFTFDNTTFQYRQTHKVKGKVQRRSRASKPSTPAEVRVQLVCGIEEYRAGEVVEFRGSGPINGRWIIADATRNCLKDIFTSLVLQPPLEPLPEPKATAGTEAPAGSSASGSALAAFEASDALSRMQLPYLLGGGHGTNGLEGVKAGDPGLDCSGSTCWVLKQAGMFTGSTAEVSGDLETFGEAGPGKEMTVWAGPNHVYIEFNIPGHEQAQMNTNGPQNGPRLYTVAQTPTFNGPNGAGSGGPFVARHWKGT